MRCVLFSLLAGLLAPAPGVFAVLKYRNGCGGPFNNNRPGCASGWRQCGECVKTSCGKSKACCTARASMLGRVVVVLLLGSMAACTSPPWGGRRTALCGIASAGGGLCRGGFDYVLLMKPNVCLLSLSSLAGCPLLQGAWYCCKNERIDCNDFPANQYWLSLTHKANTRTYAVVLCSLLFFAPCCSLLPLASG